MKCGNDTKYTIFTNGVNYKIRDNYKGRFVGGYYHGLYLPKIYNTKEDAIKAMEKLIEEDRLNTWVPVV